MTIIEDTTTPSRLISQSIDALCYQIILKPEERVGSFKTLREFLKKVDRKKMVGFGRLQCSMQLANLIMKLNKYIDLEEIDRKGEKGNENGNENENEDLESESESESNLEYWEVDDWNDFVDELKALKNQLTRKDATTFLTAPLLKSKSKKSKSKIQNNTNCDGNTSDGNNVDMDLEVEDAEIDPSLASMDLFTSQFDHVLDACFLQWALSYIRLEVEDAMNGPKGSTLDVDDVEVKALYDFIQNHFSEGDTFYDHLISLFKQNNHPRGRKKSKHHNHHQLKDLKDVSDIINRKCLSLDRFRKIAERLLQNWYINVFSEPVLVSIGYTKQYDDGHGYSDGHDNDNDNNSDSSYHHREERERSIQMELDNELDVEENNKNVGEKDNSKDIHMPHMLEEQKEANEDEDGMIVFNCSDSADGTIARSFENDDNNISSQDTTTTAKTSSTKKNEDKEKMPKINDGSTKLSKVPDKGDDNKDDAGSFVPSSEEEGQSQALLPIECNDGLAVSNERKEERQHVEVNIFEQNEVTGKRKRQKTNRYVEEFYPIKHDLETNNDEFAFHDDSEGIDDQLHGQSVKRRSTKMKKRRIKTKSAKVADGHVFDIEEISPYDPQKALEEGRERKAIMCQKLRCEDKEANQEKKTPRTSESIEELADSQSTNDSLFSENDNSPKRPTLATPRRPARRNIQISDDESECKESREQKTDVQTKTPKPRKIIKRRKWTEEEDDAVRRGFLKFGKQWQIIKKTYAKQLRRRTNVNIKDCYRRMLSQGVFDDIDVDQN
jgi:hypothetical protein